MLADLAFKVLPAPIRKAGRMTTPVPIPSAAERTLGLASGSFPFESRFVEVAGARIHYVDEGSGPVLLMLHGNPTWSFVFRHLILLLRDRFRCIAPDLPGFGLSTAPAGYGFLPEEHARTIEAFVDCLALRSFTPVMQDWGGPIGFHLASRDPSRIERLVIGNTWCWPVNGDLHFEWFSRSLGSPLGKLLICRYNAFVNVFIPAGIKRRPVTVEIMEAYRRPLPTPESRMPSYIFPRSILRSRAFLAGCEASLGALRGKPALIVWGDADIAFRAKERARFEAAFPQHQTVVLRGAGHYIWEDAPDEIASALREWWS
jgi:haloalkane dehalogenase